MKATEQKMLQELNNQSSVEWLAQQLYEQMEMCGDGGVYDKIIKQAKVLHEQEIVDAYYGELYYESTNNGKHYYKETFGDINNGEITMMGGDNNIPDTNNMTGNKNNNTSTTGNLSGNIWGGDTSSNTLYDSNTWRSWQKSIDENNNRIAEEKKIWDGTTMAEYLSKTEAEKQIWDKTVNWDIRNKYTRVNDEEQAPYKVKTNVVTSGKTDDGTLAVIEITVKVKQQ
jgi:hypothetical protein